MEYTYKTDDVYENVSNVSNIYYLTLCNVSNKASREDQGGLKALEKANCPWSDQLTGVDYCRQVR